MVEREFHRSQQEQCAAAKEIKEHYAVESALSYFVGEKLINFAEVAEQRPEFVHELPLPRLPKSLD